MSVFEIGMLICFGFAWPTAIYKSYTSRSNKGKSLLFLFVVLSGYVFGILHKLFVNQDYVIVLYIINFAMVGIDIVLYYRNKRLMAQQ